MTPISTTADSAEAKLLKYEIAEQKANIHLAKFDEEYLFWDNQTYMKQLGLA
jgi:hypothetical protein